MKHFFIISNEQKDANLELTHKICDYITKKGGTCAWLCDKSDCTVSLPKDTECVLTIGGDGTLMRAAGKLKNSNIPLMGINMGHLGYLCELEKENLFPCIDEMMENHCSVEKRMMLSGYLQKNGEQTKSECALNDIVIHRTASLHIIHFEIYVNGEYLNSYHADGIICSTATGSTAYNLSAGGPIVDPKAELILLTPINSHMLQARSIILSAEDRVEIVIGSRGSGNDASLEVSFDGKNGKILHEGDRVVIERAKESTSILKLSNLSFLQTLSKKMNSYH